MVEEVAIKVGPLFTIRQPWEHVGLLENGLVEGYFAVEGHQ